MEKLIVGKNDMATLYPNLLEEWDYELNSKYDPYKMFVRGSQKINWICKKGHKWEARIYSRTNPNSIGCPYCAGIYPIKGENDFKTLYPEIAQEWDFEKNGDLKPEDMLPFSGKKVWWKCKNGHSWEAVIENRTIELTGCPKCSAETQTSFPEQAIYYYLSQKVECINRYRDLGFEIDIFIPKYNIGIEYDGLYAHSGDKSIKKEIKKDTLAYNHGISLFRIKECRTEKENSSNVIYIKNDAKKYYNLGLIIKEFAISKLDEKIDDIDIVRDRVKIWERYKKQSKEFSLSRIAPDVAKEWHKIKNGSITPDMVNAKTHDKYWWKCAKGHEWETAVYHRTSGDRTNCPYCSNKKVWRGFNDLASVYPEIAKEWDYSKNECKPDEVIATSPKKYFWLCKRCKTSFEQSLYKRIFDKQGCPVCAGKIVKKGVNDFKTKFPQLAQEWDYNKNELKPEEITPYSNKKCFWICSLCGEKYSMSANHRAKGRGCPLCAKGKRINSYKENHIKKGNSLAEKRPDLLAEWDYEANMDNPNHVSYASNKKYHWVCSKNNKHKYEMILSNKTGKNKAQGCPFCSGRRAFEGETDIFSTNPELKLDWDFEKNDLNPSQVTAGSNKTVAWKCHICGNEWMARIVDRSKGKGKCKKCKA